MKRQTSIHESNDLTSMVDVTFLLLIFFVVTASFVTTRAMQTETPDLASNNPTEVETSPLRIVVDEHNQFFVGEDGVEDFLSTPRELRDAIRSAKDRKQIESLLIEAHEDSRHKAVVQVCDASRAVGVSRIKVNPYK
jgi:biopolymer transport protein ExbD